MGDDPSPVLALGFNLCAQWKPSSGSGLSICPASPVSLGSMARLFGDGQVATGAIQDGRLGNSAFPGPSLGPRCFSSALAVTPPQSSYFQAFYIRKGKHAGEPTSTPSTGGL